ncbi:MAG: fused MFS/spermidine synthase [Planctomycetes bacterium]|nr:fused MFS/spermidine synthase [Planctomycetota bacterium]
MGSHAAAIFLGAFLLFLVQPLVAKTVLPWFGGSAGVWSACMLFFQVALLLGYAYAHGSARFLGPRARKAVHLALLALTLPLLPMTPDRAWAPVGAQEPIGRILGLLATSVGLPYFLLSASSPLLQHWYATSGPRRSPYRLYAVSNAGSLLGLLAYPLLVEPFLPLRAQAGAWSAAYALFALLCAWVAFRSPSVEAAPPAVAAAADATPGERPGWGRFVLWIALAACATSLLLAVTNQLTRDLPPVPFLWILPLVLYLLSLIACFESDRWYRRSVWLPALAVGLVGIFCALRWATDLPLGAAVLLHGFGLSAGLMVCHGELVSLRPQASHLTTFYLMCSLGGALGGLFVGLVAPMVFDDHHELWLSLVACVVLARVVARRDLSAPDAPETARWRLGLTASLGIAAFLCVFSLVELGAMHQKCRVLARNFYGSLRVLDLDFKTEAGTRKIRRMVHGTITHGQQFLDPERARLATGYYGPASGVGLALLELRTGTSGNAPLRVGVVGLGVGTLAAYGRPGDAFRFYELNPLVADLARTEFRYLPDCAAAYDVVLGDGRVSLENETSPQGFDLLAIDAFSSDSIPVHLLTAEAFRLYFRHLKPDGVLAVHLSNRALDLRPVVLALAAAEGKPTAWIDSEPSKESGTEPADWMLVTSRAGFLERPAIRAATQSVAGVRTDVRAWTDDYSSLLPVLR